jgi:hypothetical protein
MTTAFGSTDRGHIPVAETMDSATRSGVSWAAIFAGAVAALAITTILLVLGAGLGLAVMSPWHGAGAAASTVGVWAVIWLVIVQWISSGIGGFLAGRLRTKWIRLHTHEVFFRDTAHGFLAWAVASIAGTLLLATIATSGIGGIVKATANVGAAATSAAGHAATRQGAGSGGGSDAYFVDTMFRSTGTESGDKGAARGEATRILAESAHQGKVTLSSDDKTYLTNLVAARAGISASDAGKRVDAAVNQLNAAAQKVRVAADHARKRTAQLSIILALSMLVGAFIGCIAGALGGGIRDEF